MARQEAMRAAGVFAAFVVQAAQDRIFVGHAGQTREVFTDVEAGDVGANRLERAANLRGSARLQVERFQMARSAVGPEEDDRKARIAAALVGRQELGQVRRLPGTKGAETEAADFQPGAAIHRAGTGSKRVGGWHGIATSRCEFGGGISTNISTRAGDC